MRRVKSLVSLFVLLLLAITSPSCFFPEQFEATIYIGKDRTYSIVYDGILTYVPAKAAEAEGQPLSAKDEQDLKGAERDFAKDPNFKSVRYIGHGQFRVLFKKEGRLDSSVYLFDPDLKIASIIPTKANQVEVTGMKIGPDDIKQLRELKMGIDGRLYIKTDAKVIRHNASSEPWLFGLIGSYGWKIQSVSDPAPYMLIELAP
jgi:hypothetical protein